MYTTIKEQTVGKTTRITSALMVALTKHKCT